MNGAVAFAGLLLAAGQPPPIAFLADLGTTLSACIKGDALEPGLKLDIRFVLSRRGTLVGAPVIVTRAAPPVAGLRSVRSACSTPCGAARPSGSRPISPRVSLGMP